MSEEQRIFDIVVEQSYMSIDWKDNPLNVNLKVTEDYLNYKIVDTLNIRDEFLEIFDDPESQNEQIKSAVEVLRDLANELESLILKDSV